MPIKKILNPVVKFLRKESYAFAKMDEFRQRFGKLPNFFKPRSLTERLYIRMAFDRDPKWALFTDKYLVRDYVQERCGQEVLTKLYAVIDDVKEIPSLSLPDQFVMKPNHLSDGILKIVRDFKAESVEELEKLAQGWFKIRYNEWAYKNIKPKLLFEELLGPNHEVPDDYKFYCFNGKVKFFEIHRGRFTQHLLNLYDLNFNQLPVRSTCFDNFKEKPDFPSNFRDMVEISEKLSKETDFVRVDLYNIEGRIVFGELTVYPGGGLDMFIPLSWDETFGSYWP